MTPVRSLARVMLSGILVVEGARSLAAPGRLTPAATPMANRVAPLLRRAVPGVPTDTETLIRANGAVQFGAGLLLATGRLTRPAALVLAGTQIPGTIAGHPFWTDADPEQRVNNQLHFLKNLGLVGGLLLAAADTAGKPGLRWRAGQRLGHSQRWATRAARTARRQARTAVRSAATARRFPG
ncbi:DoxX family protein [Salinispora sp. H7-4]|uniref:DoxX family protein n=1 Tax=Salinispora sp. H7-4 TaxID=2748321 RepID=UPI0015D38A6C|nr:DoxX family protein [Salinispora sp. H7-4]NYT93617.1 DoxX family protein [Salinispora sp. H7-4]